MPAGNVVVALRGVSKDYRSLRPLRIANLELREAQSVALLGLDLTASEVLVNLITGATLPDSGEVDVFGTSTNQIADADAWLAEMDRFGILSERVVVLDAFTIEQNLALPFSLEIDVLPDELRGRVRALADEVGIPAERLAAQAAALDAELMIRVRLAKALACGPRVLLAEHPNAALSREAALRLAADLKRVAEARQLTMLIMTADLAFARAVSHETFTVRPATGELTHTSAWRRWFQARP